LKKAKKMKFEVLEGESISDCLQRMDKEGYTPVRRMERPVFKEVKEKGKIEQKHYKQQIIFEGKIKGDESK
jgi:hypothetical protein